MAQWVFFSLARQSLDGRILQDRVVGNTTNHTEDSMICSSEMLHQTQLLISMSIFSGDQYQNRSEMVTWASVSWLAMERLEC